MVTVGDSMQASRERQAGAVGQAGTVSPEFPHPTMALGLLLTSFSLPSHWDTLRAPHTSSLSPTFSYPWLES